MAARKWEGLFQPLVVYFYEPNLRLLHPWYVWLIDTFCGHTDDPIEQVKREIYMRSDYHSPTERDRVLTGAINTKKSSSIDEAYRTKLETLKTHPPTFFNVVGWSGLNPLYWLVDGIVGGIFHGIGIGCRKICDGISHATCEYFAENPEGSGAKETAKKVIRGLAIGVFGGIKWLVGGVCALVKGVTSFAAKLFSPSGISELASGLNKMCCSNTTQIHSIQPHTAAKPPNRRASISRLMGPAEVKRVPTSLPEESQGASSAIAMSSLGSTAILHQKYAMPILPLSELRDQGPTPVLPFIPQTASSKLNSDQVPQGLPNAPYSPSPSPRDLVLTQEKSFTQEGEATPASPSILTLRS